MTATVGVARKRGYVAGVMGALGGGVLGTLIGIVAGIFYVENFMPNAGLDGLLPPIFAAAAGGTFGAGGGTWLALKARRHRAPGVTGLVVGGLTPFVMAGSAVASSYLGHHVLRRTDEDWIFPVLAAVGIVTVVAVIRTLVARGRGSDWDVPPH